MSLELKGNLFFVVGQMEYSRPQWNKGQNAEETFVATQTCYARLKLACKDALSSQLSQYLF